MPRYTVNHRYSSNHNGRQFGPWEPGIEIELDEPDAEWVNRDSPGTVELVRPKQAKAPAGKAAGRGPQ